MVLRADSEGEAWLMAGAWPAQGRREEGWSWLRQEGGRAQAEALSEEDNWSLLHDIGNGRSGADSAFVGGQRLEQVGCQVGSEKERQWAKKGRGRATAKGRHCVCVKRWGMNSLNPSQLVPHSTLLQ